MAGTCPASAIARRPWLLRAKMRNFTAARIEGCGFFVLSKGERRHASLGELPTVLSRWVIHRSC